jgi:hypothetical protein
MIRLLSNGQFKDVDHFVNAKLAQCVITKFLWSEKRNAIEIHSRLLRAFQADTYMLSSPYEWVRVFKTRRTSLLDELGRGSRLDRIDFKILLLFTENEFHNVRLLHRSWGFL